MKSIGATFRHCQDILPLYFEGGMSTERFSRCQAEWYEIAAMYSKGDGVHHFYSPALGYDLRVAGQVGEAESIVYPPRNRSAEIAGAAAKVLKEDTAAYKVARSVWRAVRGRGPDAGDRR